MIKNSPANAGDMGPILGLEDPLEEKIATHSSTLAWKIPWTEEPGGLQSTGSQRVGHDRACKQLVRKEGAHQVEWAQGKGD